MLEQAQEYIRQNAGMALAAIIVLIVIVIYMYMHKPKSSKRSRKAIKKEIDEGSLPDPDEESSGSIKNARKSLEDLD